jgi:hypothetical protein
MKKIKVLSQVNLISPHQIEFDLQAQTSKGFLQIFCSAVMVDLIKTRLIIVKNIVQAYILKLIVQNMMKKKKGLLYLNSKWQQFNKHI